MISSSVVLLGAEIAMARATEHALEAKRPSRGGRLSLA
jgi:hypothetical protein